MKDSIEQRFWKKVRKSSGCWQWLARIDDHGYARFGDATGRNCLAHRWVYELVNGPIPSDRQLDHLCRNRGCVNPAHLEAVTSKENTLRGNTVAARNASRTHCPHGHPYTPENTRPHVYGGRVCGQCAKDRAKRYYARKKQSA